MKNIIKNILSSISGNNTNNIFATKFIEINECSDKSNKYDYAHNDVRLRKNLLGEDESTHVNKFLLKRDPQFLTQYKQFEKILSNKYFNPYKYYELSEYYIKSDSFKELDIIYTFKNNQILKQNIALKGDKGSGKTALINCWLKENNDNLEKNNIFWVRCDGHKLYKLWLKYFSQLREDVADDGSVITIEEYLSIQFVYVFCKYCISEDRYLIKKVLQDIHDQKISYDYPSSRRSPNQKEKRLLYDGIVEARDTILVTEKDKEDDYSYAFDHIMIIATNANHKWEKRKWIALSDALQSYFKNNDYWILRIVDGVDNIHINDISSKPYYESMLDMSFNFLRRCPQDKQINFMAMRERTFYECLTRPPMPDTMGYFDVHEIKHKSPCFKKVLSARNNFAKNRYKDGSLFSEICQHVCEKIPDNVNVFHHNNVRTFLYNKLSLTSQVYYRIRQLGGGTLNIMNHIRTLQDRNKFLNGRLFLHTIDDWHNLNSELGLCCMNIFYFNLNNFACRCANEWQGLCKTRILQLLSFYQRLTKEQIDAFLHDGLEYNNELIDQNISDLKAFGMIDTKFDHYIYLTISEKGDSYLNQSYSNIDTLYYFAIDTPLPISFFDDELINTHSNKFGTRTNYPYSAISTTLTLLFYLSYVNNIENYKLANNLGKIDKVYSGPIMKLTLPFQEKETYENILNNFFKLIDSRVEADDQTELLQINNFINKLQ